ncbi:transcriptional repressor [Ceratobasidium sp. 395]|nr:transcriptional repressor [Ceratobasidium sp. 395]
MSRASTHAPMLSQPPSPALAGPSPLQQPTPPQHQQAWSSMPPPPPPGQADDKEQAKPDTASAPASPGTSAATAAQKAKKKHVCATCSRPFSTSGHLARHTRVHTGERNHKCPFPGCETRCSRQDNLQQHYRIHLSPKSRRTSNSAATRAAIARAIESAVHDDMSGQGVHATHPSPHPYPSPYPPPHPHYAAAPPYGAYPQHPPNGSPVYPGQPQFMPAPGQPHPMHYPYPPMSYAYPPPAPGQPPVHMQGAPQPPPGHAAVHNGHHPQYAPYPTQRTPNGAAYTPQQSPHLAQQTMAQSAATSRAASTSGSNSPVQQSPRTTQAAPLPAANALGLQNGVNGPVKSNQWNGQVDQNGAALGPDGRPQYANGAYAYPSPYPSETGSAQNLPAPLPPNQRPRGAGMPSPQSPGRTMNGSASGPPTPSTYAPQQVIQLEPTQGQPADGRSPRPTLPPISYRSPQVPNGQYASGNVAQPGGVQLPQGKMPVSNTRGRAT